jgi:DNA repair protein RadA/Sms
MAKAKTVFFCTECGNETIKWQGQCPSCKAWNTIAEHEAAPKPASRSSSSAWSARTAVRLKDVDITRETRFSTGMPELDRVLGGGAVKGSLVLVGGSPGIGKSTLLLQLCGRVSPEAVVIYVSGEESGKQLKMRAERLGADNRELLVLAETNLTDILENVRALAPIS